MYKTTASHVGKLLLYAATTSHDQWLVQVFLLNLGKNIIFQI